uniref:Uncharacterized protein n=1 Tax=Panstrongylus lignarius TaxID=156445 RepID=A0A224XXQ5_9HEMI
MSVCSSFSVNFHNPLAFAVFFALLRSFAYFELSPEKCILAKPASTKATDKLTLSIHSHPMKFPLRSVFSTCISTSFCMHFSLVKAKAASSVFGPSSFPKFLTSIPESKNVIRCESLGKYNLNLEPFTTNSTRASIRDDLIICGKRFFAFTGSPQMSFTRCTGISFLACTPLLPLIALFSAESKLS